MTPAELLELRALAEAATPGPWDCDSVDIWNLTDAGQGFEPGRYVDSIDIVSGRCEECGTYQGVKRDSDAAFIAAARSAVPALLDRVEALEAEAVKLRAVYEAAKTWCDSFYVGKPHPRWPAYPHDEILHTVNAVRFGADDALAALVTK